jgi:hypothetical protein
MNEIFEKDVAVDGPVANEGERSSATFSTGQGPLVGSLERGQRWTVRRKQEAVLRQVLLLHRVQTPFQGPHLSEVPDDSRNDSRKGLHKHRFHRKLSLSLLQQFACSRTFKA